MAFIDHNDLIVLHDERVIKDLLEDEGTPVVDLAGSDRLTALMETASARIMAAVLVGGMYTKEDLDTLAASADPADYSLLRELASNGTMILLFRRRPEKIADQAVKGMVAEHEEYLDRLRKGERLFPIQQNIDAGQPTIDGPTAVEYERLNTFPDRIRNTYPVRGSRLPLGR